MNQPLHSNAITGSLAQLVYVNPYSKDQYIECNGAKRFRIAFSFAREKREFVEKVAGLLARSFGEEAILYDKFHEAEFSRARLGRYLPKLYHDQSDLVVVVICRDYVGREWCGLEWDAIFDLFKQGRESEVMLCRFGHAMVPGLFIAGFVEFDDKTPDQAATLVLERFALNEGKSKDYYTKPSSAGDKVSRSSISNKQVERRQKGGDFTGNDVFISCKNLDEQGVQTRDAEIAAEVYDLLTGKGLSVFLSTLTLEELGVSDYTTAIDSALKSASVLLAIGTSTDHLESNWVKYEWNSFANAIRSGRKSNGRIFTYIEGMPITDLPWGLQQTQTFVHGKGSLQRLYNFINKALPPPGSSTLVIGHGTQTHAGRLKAPSQAGTPTMSRKQVFISYSHKDKKWRDEFDTNLKPYLRGGSIVSWSDQQIAPGSEWFREIQSALANSKVAVLLVSPDFLASDFTYEQELGPLLKEAEQGGVKILWVPVRAKVYKQTPLKNYQAVLDPSKPLAKMTKAQRDRAWVEVCQVIEGALTSPLYKSPKVAPSMPTTTDVPTSRDRLKYFAVCWRCISRAFSGPI